MTAAAHASALQDLAAVPGVVGSLVFDARGGVLASAFPPVFDASGLRTLAERLAGDGYFHQWMTTDAGTMELRYADGLVSIRSIADAWLLVLSTPAANAQLLSMSLTQVVRRLRAAGPLAPAEPPRVAVAAPAQAAPAPAPPPSPVDRLRAIVQAELGGHAAKALEILAAAGPGPKDLARAIGDVEKLTRLFIDRKKADEIGRAMREALRG